MSRVEWTRLEGNDVEAVVAMFVNRERENSVRITPSRGDGGVDILDPRSTQDGFDDVYQVKKYTEPLTAQQRTEIETSLSTLLSDDRWSDLRLGTWYLVTPWGPTPEAFGWLESLGAKHGVTARWRGLDFVEQLAAKYPDVVDYYLHGGATRIADAFNAVLALSALDERGAPEGDVRGVADRIQRALPTLDNDPHFRYELQFGEGDVPDRPRRPGLVMSTIRGYGSPSRWVAVDVIARCAASTTIRPIKIAGTFTIDKDHPFAAALRDFRAYGTPFTAPEGAYTGEIDAPGGLGGPLEGGVVRTLALEDNIGDNREIHVDLIDPAGAIVASADLVRTERTAGRDGMRVVLSEVNGLFTIEDRHNTSEQSGSRNLQFGWPADAPVAVAHAAYTFLVSCQPPNIGRISLKHAPPDRGVHDLNWGFTWPEGEHERLAATLRLIDDLLEIQRRTATVLRVPATVTQAQIAEWGFAASMLREHEIEIVYPEDHQVLIEVGPETPEGEPFGQLEIALPLTVEVGSANVELGTMIATLENATLRDRTSRGDTTVLALTTPDRTVRYRLMAREPEDGDPGGRGT